MIKLILVLLSIQFLYYPCAFANQFLVGSSLSQGGLNVTSAEQEKRSEGPYSFEIFVDYLKSARWNFGFSHLRSLQMSPTASSIGVSTLYGRFYYYSPQTIFAENSDSSHMQVEQFAPYSSLGAGFAQSSLVPQFEGGPAVSAAGITASFKNGVEYATSSGLIYHAELNLTQSLIGTGKISFMNLYFGVGYVF